MLPTILLLGGSLLLLASRVYLPGAPPPSGAVVRRIAVPVRLKVRMQRMNVYALAVLLLLGSVGGWIPPVLELVVVALAMGILLVPTRYTLTDQAIALGRTSPRQWSDFMAVEVRRGVASLRPRDGSAPIPVWLPVASERDPQVVLMTRLISGEGA